MEGDRLFGLRVGEGSVGRKIKFTITFRVSASGGSGVRVKELADQSNSSDQSIYPLNNYTYIRQPTLSSLLPLPLSLSHAARKPTAALSPRR